MKTPTARTAAAALAALLLTLVVIVQTGAAAAPDNRNTSTAAPQARTFSNPVLGQGQDPSVVTYGGWYYYTQSAPDGTSLTVRRSRSLKTLAAAPRSVVWRGGQAGSPCCEWWAPELHRLDGDWYIYAAADTGNNDGHRLQVLRATAPLGPYTYLGRLDTPGGHWAIDPSPLRLPDGRLYLFWSGWPGDGNGVQNIYIARLADPWTVTGPSTLLSTPTYPFELHSGSVPVKVNESPEPIVHGGTVSVTYSASGCWTPDYSLGLLSANVHADLLAASSWTKSRTSVLHGDPAAGIYGSASNGWFTSPDGRQTWTVFHAVNDPNGNCGLERGVYAQPVAWNADGTPRLGGRPLPGTAVLTVPSGDPGGA